MSDDIFGQSNYGGNFVKKNWYKLKDGSLSFRILPALGECAKDGRWSVFARVHYGYKNSKGQLRTFESSLVKNNKTKMIEVPDAAVERIEKLKAAFEQAKKDGNKEAIAQLDKLVGQKGQYNLDSNHYMNVIDEAGNIGILKIRHRAKVALDAEIKRLRAEGIDPLSPDNGRYFTFTRSGMGLDTTFQVVAKQEQVDVPGYGLMKRDVVSKLTPEIAARCAVKQSNGTIRYVEAANLLSLFKKPTAEQIARIVKEGAPAVDEILDAKSGDSTPDTSGDDSDAGDYDDTPTAQSAAPAAAPQQAAPAPAPAPVQTANVFTPAPAQTLAEAPKPTPAPAQTVATADEAQSAADFLKSLGL